MKYLLKIRNLESGKIEIYNTEAENRDKLQPFLDFWENEAGYEIISVEEIEYTNWCPLKGDSR